MSSKKDAFFARTMHTPDDPARAELRAALREVSRALLPLHRALIDAAKLDYTYEIGPIDGPNQLFGLLQEHEYFAWLKPMTSLIVDIDELARKDFTPEDVAAIAARIERMFGTDVDAAFAGKYVPILQREIDVAVGHAAVRKAAAKLSR